MQQKKESQLCFSCQAHTERRLTLLCGKTMRNLNSERQALRATTQFPVPHTTSCVLKEPPTAASDPFSQQFLGPLSVFLFVECMPQHFGEDFKDIVRNHYFIHPSHADRMRTTSYLFK